MMSCVEGGAGRGKKVIFHDEGGRGVRQKVMLHDEGGREGQAKSDFV